MRARVRSFAIRVRSRDLVGGACCDFGKPIGQIVCSIGRIMRPDAEPPRISSHEVGVAVGHTEIAHRFDDARIGHGFDGSAPRTSASRPNATS